jgi:hypothetical protein
MGHLIPFAELARRLVADQGLGATLLFAAATDTPSEQYASLAASVPDGVNLIALPAPPADALPPTATARERAVHAAVSSVPHVREIAQSLTSAAPLAALVVDLVSGPARDVATDAGRLELGHGRGLHRCTARRRRLGGSRIQISVSRRGGGGASTGRRDQSRRCFARARSRRSRGDI